jgi:hypothetical protein
VRYSVYPGRHALDLIWGHVDYVGEQPDLPPPTLEPDPALAAKLGRVKPCRVANDAPWCFLSHNLHDVLKALEVREERIDRGYGVWLAETEIMHGEMITAKVQPGLGHADRFVVLMSRNALMSRWVLKESELAIRQLAQPPVVVVDPIRGNWRADWGARVDAILTEHGYEPASTLLGELLPAFDDVPIGRRIVLPCPPPTDTVAPFATWDAVFPRLGATLPG